MDVVLHHRFTPDVREVGRAGTRISLDVRDWKTLTFSVPSASIADAIEALGGDGAALETLVTLAAAGVEVAEATRWVGYYLERFRRARLLEWVARCGGDAMVTFRSLTSGFGPADGTPPERAMTLSRFAYVRRVGADLVLESPETPCRAILTGAGTDLVRRAAEGRPAPPATDPRLAPFWRAGFLEPAAGPESEARATWEFHDRLFHAASRAGRDAIPLGGTYRFEGRRPAPAAIKSPTSGASIALARPDLAAIAAGSDRLAALMDRRRSNRTYAADPIRLEQLSEFLFRLARITRVFSSGGQELMSRPFPSGGSIYETEFYLAVGACQGLAPGLYYYRGLEHALEALPNTGDGTAQLLKDAALAMGQPEVPPQVLVVLTCRLPRLAWKYEGMAYRLALMNAGVVVQTMYLVATDMQLAACANGSGNSQRFADITGLDPLEETAIAELALGSPA